MRTNNELAKALGISLNSETTSVISLMSDASSEAGTEELEIIEELPLFDIETDEELCVAKHEYEGIYSCQRYDFPGEIECYFYAGERHVRVSLEFLNSTRRRVYFTIEDVDSDAEEEESEYGYSNGEFAPYGGLDFGSESE